MPRSWRLALFPLPALGGQGGYAPVDLAELRDLLGRMTTEEKLHQTCIDTECPESQMKWLKCQDHWPTVAESLAHGTASLFIVAEDGSSSLRDLERLGVAGLHMRDGTKGLRCTGYGPPCPASGRSPAFPAQSARAATWSVELEEEFGAAIAGIAETIDVNVALLPCVNVLPWLNWGRGQESFGEDPVFSGKMGAAEIRGVQRSGRVMATAKHYLANNVELRRPYVSAEMTEKMLHEVYLKAWAVLLEESAPEMVMTAYNRVQGRYVFEIPKFIDILRARLGFEGSVMTDWFATHEKLMSGMVTSDVGGPFAGRAGFLRPSSVLASGVDMEMPFCSKNRDLVAQLQGCSINDTAACAASNALDTAVAHILRSKMRYGLVRPPASGPDPAQASPPNRTHATLVWDERRYSDLALRIAHEGVVLLKNRDGFLPRRPHEVRKVIVSGDYYELAMGDVHGSSKLISDEEREQSVMTALEFKYGKTKVRTSPGVYPDAVEMAHADMIVIVVTRVLDEGEFFAGNAGDRVSLGLPVAEVDIINWAAHLNPNVVVIVQAGQTVLVEDFVDRVKAVLWMSYGSRMGEAAAAILAGDVNPSGRMVTVTPKQPSDYVPAGISLAPWELSSLPYPYAYGFKHMWAAGIEPRFPMGFGLSYTTFAHGAPALSRRDAAGLSEVTVRVNVTNTGARAGKETVQVYAACPACREPRLSIVLLGFRKVSLGPGETAAVEVVVSVRELAVYSEASGRWLLEAGQYLILTGPHLSAPELSGAELLVGDSAEFDYPRAGGGPSGGDPLLREPRDCSSWECMPEEAKIKAWSLPSDWTWNYLTLVQMYTPFGDASLKAYVDVLLLMEPHWHQAFEWALVACITLMLHATLLSHCFRLFFVTFQHYISRTTTGKKTKEN